MSPDEHITWVGDIGLIKCDRCRRHKWLDVPMSLERFTRELGSFKAEHTDCVGTLVAKPAVAPVAEDPHGIMPLSAITGRLP